MKDLSIKEFSDLVYEKLENLYKNKPILSNPNTESKFPILELLPIYGFLYFLILCMPLNGLLNTVVGTVSSVYFFALSTI